MKVLFISNLFPDQREPDRGQVNATLLHALSEFCEIRVVSPRPTLPLLGGENVLKPRAEDLQFQPVYPSSYYLPKVGGGVNHKMMAGSMRNLIENIRSSFPFDIVLCSWVYPDGCAITALAKQLHFPFVLISQGSDLHEYLSMPLRRRVIAEALRSCPALIARSAELARLAYGAGADEKKVSVIYNGVDLTIFNPRDKDTVRRQLGLSLTAKIILYVGSLLPIKNPAYLLDSFAKLKSLQPDSDYRLILVGEGALLPSLRSRAESLEISRDCLFVGQKPSPEVARYMQAANTLCVSSDNEGVPNVIYEAFACGLPVVATKVGGIPEVVRESFLGQLVEKAQPEAMAKALIQVVGSANASERISNYARQFSWPDTAAKYFKVLQTVTSPGPSVA